MIDKAQGPLKLWSLGWVVIVRLILYLVVIGFLLQYMYFGEKGQFFHPGAAVLRLTLVFFVNLAILALGRSSRHINSLLALTFVLDIAVLTRVILVSGGFNSVFIPYYLPVLVMATAWLPRTYTAVFPSMATFGIAYIGLAHLMVALDEKERVAFLYPEGLLHTLRLSLAHSVVATMLIFAVLFFVISYLSGMLSDKLFIEQRLNAEVLSSMQEGVAVVSARHELMYANSEFVRIFPEAKGTEDFNLAAEAVFHPEADGITLERLLADRSGRPVVIARDGDAAVGRPPLEIHSSGITLRGKKELFGLLILVTDLTLRKRMEAAERGLERFSAISTMAAGLAHEIRNPLASLRSAIQEIGDAFPEGSQNRVLTDVVIAESDRLDGIVGRFLDFSREGFLHPAKVRLGAALGDLKTFLEHDERAGGIQIRLDIRDDPEIICDPDRMREVFLNLALNAIQAVPADAGRLDIVLESAVKGLDPGVEILFLDNGPGIDGQTARHIFEPFFSSKPDGTGMGLPLSRKQAAMHGGDIEYATRPEGGACFRVWLPMKPVGRRRAGTRVMAGWRSHFPGQRNG